MEIQKATMDDLPQILELYAQARQFMVDTGNPRQWAARNWPPLWLLEQDIQQGKLYVCRAEGVPAAVFYYDFGDDIDLTYRRIDNGSWLSDAPYGVVHRIAARKGSGAGKHCINWAWERSGHLRIDTHEDNRVMRHVLQQLGFQHCGIIYVSEDNDPRIAFEKV